MVRLLEVYGWTTLFLIGSLLSVWNLRECIRDWRDLRDYGLDGLAEAAAKYEIGSEAIRLGELVAGLGTGLFSIVHVYWPILYLLFILPIGLAINTYRAYRYRAQWGQKHIRRKKGEGHAD